MHPSTSTDLISARIKRQLQSLDWDFPEYLPGSSKSIHWYPGTFPGELPFTLIQALTKPNDLIMDPYGGVGTTALEALRLGRKAWLVEINPIGLLSAYVSGCLILLKSKNEIYPQLALDLIKELIEPEKDQIRKAKLIHEETFESACDDLLSQLVRPNPLEFSKDYFENEPAWDSLSTWIETSTLEDIKNIYTRVLNGTNSSFIKLLALTMISGSLRAISSQIKSWGHIADNVRPKQFEKKDAVLGCTRWISRTKKIINNIVLFQSLSTLSNEPRLYVTRHNWSEDIQPAIRPKQKANTLITSPPYADAIDYTFAQRLSLYLLGLKDSSIHLISAKEIGARRRRTKSTSQLEWANQLVDAMSKQMQYMDKTSYITLVLPHKEAGRDIGSQNLEEHLINNSWTKAFETDRSIRQLRTRQSWTSIKKETIQIYSNLNGG